MTVELDALARQPRGGSDDLGQGEATEPLMRVEQAEKRSGHPDRAEAHVEDLVRTRETHGHGEEMRLERARVQPVARSVDEEVEEAGTAVHRARQ
jgi:hypothetical protein